MRALAARIARLEAAKRDRRPAPFVLHVALDETHLSARERFDAQWPDHRRTPLIVPSKPRTEAEQEVWADQFVEQQASLVRNAKRERVAIDVAPDEPRHRVPVWPSSPLIRPNSPHVYWKPNNGTKS